MHWYAAPNPAEPLRHNGTAPLRMRRGTPEEASTHSAVSESSPRSNFHVEPVLEWPRRKTRLHVNTRSHKRNAVTQAAIDTAALVCSGSRCSSP